MYACVYVCIYIYIYIHMYMCVYVCVYVHSVPRVNRLRPLTPVGGGLRSAEPYVLFAS